MFLFSPPLANSADQITVANIFGNRDLHVVRDGKVEKEKVRRGAVLAAGDEVGTDATQIVTLESEDGSKWKVAPSTRLKLEKSSGDSGIRLLSLLRGAMWGLAPAAGEKDKLKLKIRTTNAAMGVRGTEYLIEDRPDFSAIDVLKGEVWWGSSPDFPEGSFILVKAGQRSILKKPKSGASVSDLQELLTAPVPSKKSLRSLQEHYGLVGGLKSPKKK